MYLGERLPLLGLLTLCVLAGFFIGEGVAYRGSWQVGRRSWHVGSVVLRLRCPSRGRIPGLLKFFKADPLLLIQLSDMREREAGV